MRNRFYNADAIWNGAGDEAVEMMKWGQETFKC